METESTALETNDWVVFAHRHGHTVRLGSSAEFVPGGPPPPAAGFERLMATDGRTAWWAYTLQWKGIGPIVTNIAAAPVTGGRPRMVVRRANFPVTDRGGLLYVRDSVVLPQMGDRFEIRFLGATGKDVLVRGGDVQHGEDITGLCASANVLAWAVFSPKDNPGARLYVQQRSTGRIRTIQLRDGGGSMDLGCGDDFVAWGNGSGSGDASQYVFQTNGKLFRLGRSPGISGALVAGRYVAWTLPPTRSTEPAATRIVRWR
jgi:hypothetical protein